MNDPLFYDTLHSFKGLCGTIGATYLYQIALSVETKPNPKELKKLHNELTVVFKRDRRKFFR